MINKKNKIIVCLCLFIFMFFVSSLSTLNYINSDNNTNLENLETSDTNYFFNSKNYSFSLDSFYDDAVLNKTFTGAKFQTEWFNDTELAWSGTYDNDTVLPVNNTNTKSPSDTDVTMIDGTFDDTDNMRANDDSYSDFTSTALVPPPSDEFIDSITYTKGSSGIGVVANTWADDSNFKRVDSAARWADPPGFWIYEMELTFVFDPVPGGRDFYISADIVTNHANGFAFLQVNGGDWKSGLLIDFDDNYHADVTSIGFRAYTPPNLDFNVDIFYFKILGAEAGGYAEVNYTIDVNFSEVPISDLLAIDVSSHHYTDVSTIIAANIYNYDTSSYVEMWSTDVIAESWHYWMNDTIPEDFISGTGNVRLRFNGTNTVEGFEMYVDYINVTFYYKLDLEHSKAFDTNGVFRYRWEITGSIHYTQWVTFEVIDPASNFYAISESDYITRWILQGSDISPVENFTDDISGANWDLTDISKRFMYTSSNPDGDSYAESISADVNFGGATNLRLMKVGGDCWIFLEEITPYLTSNVTGNSTLTIYSYDGFVLTNVLSYTTTEFDENTITWNNQPTYRDYQDLTVIAAADGWKVIDLGNNITDYYVLETNTGASYHVFYSTEHATKPIINHNISKKYQGGGYMYMQTNTTESLGLQSTDYGTHYNLSSGDYFEVDFQTSSDSQIDLLLYQDGVLNKSLVLSASGNTNFNNQTVQISVDEFVEFDQLKISSTLEDQDNIKIYDIKTYKYTLTGDYVDFNVGSNRDRETYLTPDVYNLRIFDPYDGDAVINENITIPATGIEQYIYIPESLVSKIECLLTLFPVGGGLSLIFADYIIYVNRSYNGVYERFLLNEEIFEADELTTVYIDVYDRFELLIGTFPEPIAIRINLEIEVYSLQIKNIMEQSTVLTINATNT